MRNVLRQLFDGYNTEFDGAFDATTCSIAGFTLIEENCHEEFGQMFCTYVERIFQLTFGVTPATGTVTIHCYGECDFKSTAPIEATKTQ